MLEIEYKRDLKNHYLILNGGAGMPEDSYQIRMLQENNINGFADCHIEKVNDEARYYYQVTSLQTLEEFIDGRSVGTELLQMLLRAIMYGLRELEKYLLPQDGIVLLPSCIFLDPFQKAVFFCYCPENDQSAAEGMKLLSEFLLPRLDEGDRKAVMLGFSFYQLCASGELTEAKFQELLCASGEIGGTGMQTRSDAPDPAARIQEEKTAEELERERILDAFFSEEEEVKEARHAGKVKKVLYFSFALLSAAGAACFFAATGQVQTGIGLAVLILAAAVFLWRKRERILLAGKDFRAVRRLKKEEKEAAAEGLPDYDWMAIEEEKDDGLKSGGTDDYDDRGNREKLFETVQTVQTGTGGQEPEGIRIPEDTGDLEETVWLGADGPPGLQTCARLIQTGPGASQASVLLLLRPEHFFGKSSTAADLIIPSPAASRLHARLIRKEDGYYLIDLRSKNGTFLNETVLNAGKEYLLKDGDLIRFADITYRFETEQETAR